MNANLTVFEAIRLSKEKKTPLYAQLYEELQKLIAERTLSTGYPLPPVRKLSSLLAINVGTVVRAYRELEKNGYIYSKGGSGSYVAETSSALSCADFKFSTVEAPLPEDGRGFINLSSIALNPGLISTEAIKNVLMEVLDRDQGYAFSYQDSQGFPPLRESIVANLKKAGISTATAQVQIISGAQQGIDLAAKALLHYGDYVFVENPTYPGALAAFRSRGAKIIGIPLLPDGMDIGELELALSHFRPRLIYLMPNIQNPTGITYAAKTRNRLMGLAHRYNIPILEDDYISDLHYTDASMVPLKAVDRDDRVIYIKSFSKIFMPGLRIAFLIAPSRLADALFAAKRTTDISTSALTQRAFDLYLRKGIWQDHLHAICQLYRERFHIMLDALQNATLPQARYTIPFGGMSFWLELDKKISADTIVGKAYEKKLLLTPGREFFLNQKEDHFLRLSFATASAQEIQRGVQILSDILR